MKYTFEEFIGMNRRFLSISYTSLAGKAMEKDTAGLVHNILLGNSNLIVLRLFI